MQVGEEVKAGAVRGRSSVVRMGPKVEASSPGPG